MGFFINFETGRRTSNSLCLKCKNKCKQSYKAIVVFCPKYKSKRGAKSVKNRREYDNSRSPFFVNFVMLEFCFRFDYTFQNRTYHGFHQALILVCFSCGTALCGSTKPVFYEHFGILILSTPLYKIKNFLRFHCFIPKFATPICRIKMYPKGC